MALSAVRTCLPRNRLAPLVRVVGGCVVDEEAGRGVVVQAGREAHGECLCACAGWMGLRVQF